MNVCGVSMRENESVGVWVMECFAHYGTSHGWGGTWEAQRLLQIFSNLSFRGCSGKPWDLWIREWNFWTTASQNQGSRNVRNSCLSSINIQEQWPGRDQRLACPLYHALSATPGPSLCSSPDNCVHSFCKQNSGMGWCQIVTQPPGTITGPISTQYPWPVWPWEGWKCSGYYLLSSALTSIWWEEISIFELNSLLWTSNWSFLLHSLLFLIMHSPFI